MNVRWIATLGLGLLGFGGGCAEPLDTTRVVPVRGSLGEEIFTLFHTDMVREDARRADGFLEARDPFVDSIDHLFTPEEGLYTQEFLVRLLPLYDDGTLPASTRSVAEAMTRLLEDEAALRSLTAILQREGYVGRSHQEALLRRIAAYPEYRALTQAIIDLALKHDGLDAQGEPDEAEPAELRTLQVLLSDRLAELEISEDVERDIVLLADLLLSEDERLAGTQGPVLIVRRDARGMARLNAGGGAVAGPFVDEAPQDGLPDIDPLGRFVDGDGQAVHLPPFGAGASRDPEGRLLRSGAPVFDYADLDRTLLASLLRDTRFVIEQQVPMKAVRTFDDVLGERTEEGTYEAFGNPLLDLLHATGQSLDTSALPDVLQLLTLLVRDHEPTLGWNLVELEAQLNIADRHPQTLKANNGLMEQLLNWVRKLLLVPGLAEDLVEILQGDAVAGVDEATVLMAAHKKGLISAADYDVNNVFVIPVDRTQADVPGNQSIMQRLLHLIKDTKGAQYQPEIIGIPVGFIFEIDDLAEFYMLSIIGEAQIPGIVTTLTGLSARPGPVELARFINSEQAFGNPQGNEGIDVKDNDGDTLFAVSASGMEDALRPLVQAFWARGQLDLLFELFEILHLHWASEASDYQDSSAGQPRYSHLSGISKFEPMLIEIFTDAKVLDAVRKLLDETKALRTTSGRSAHDLLLTLGRQIMRKDNALLTRDGNSSVRIDGQRITPLSPMDLLRDALQRLDARIDRRARTRADWDEVTEVIIDRFAGFERTGPESGRLQNATAVPVLLHVLQFAEARARRHAQAGELSQWIQEDMLTVVEDALTSKELPALFDLIYAIDADETVSPALVDLRDELLDEQRGFTDLLVTLGDSLEAAKDANLAVPLLRWLGLELAPERNHLFKTLDLLQRSLQLDPDEHLLEVARRGLEEDPDTHDLYLYGLTGAVRQANRVDPLSTQVVDLNDVDKVLTKTRDYLLDDQHGVEKFYDLVEGRTLEGRR